MLHKKILLIHLHESLSSYKYIFLLLSSLFLSFLKEWFVAGKQLRERCSRCGKGRPHITNSFYDCRIFEWWLVKKLMKLIKDDGVFTVIIFLKYNFLQLI